MKNPLYLLVFCALIISSCTGQSDRTDESALITGEGIHIEGTWARPATEGRMSATYFLITNFEDEPDTLIGVQSDVAQLVEIHESYQMEGDMMGMREVPQLEIPAQSTVRLQQGGLHVMLIQLTRTLSDGDTFELTLNFANSEDITIEIPARL